MRGSARMSRFWGMRAQASIEASRTLGSLRTAELPMWARASTPVSWTLASWTLASSTLAFRVRTAASMLARFSSCGSIRTATGFWLDPGEECDDGTPTSALFDGCEQCRIVPVTLAASDAYHLGLDVFEDGSIAAAWGGLSGGLNGATFRAPNLARSGSYLQGVGADLRTLDVLALDQG